MAILSGHHGHICTSREEMKHHVLCIILTAVILLLPQTLLLAQPTTADPLVTVQKRQLMRELEDLRQWHELITDQGEVDPSTARAAAWSAMSEALGLQSMGLDGLERAGVPGLDRLNTGLADLGLALAAFDAALQLWSGQYNAATLSFLKNFSGSIRILQTQTNAGDNNSRIASS